MAKPLNLEIKGEDPAKMAMPEKLKFFCPKTLKFANSIPGLDRDLSLVFPGATENLPAGDKEARLWLAVGNLAHEVVLLRAQLHEAQVQHSETLARLKEETFALPVEKIPPAVAQLDPRSLRFYLACRAFSKGKPFRSSAIAALAGFTPSRSRWYLRTLKERGLIERRRKSMFWYCVWIE